MENTVNETTKQNDLTPEEERKNRSRKRIFWTIVGFDIALAILLLYVIVDMFI